MVHRRIRSGSKPPMRVTNPKREDDQRAVAVEPAADQFRGFLGRHFEWLGSQLAAHHWRVDIARTDYTELGSHADPTRRAATSHN